jgi:MoaA/NifB/PqqE/SkfB family radical SAM enzyme
MKRADIKVSFSCNNHCLFCVQGKKREEIKDKTYQEIKREMRQAIKDCQSIVLTGGEPTIRPDFLEIVMYAKKLGFGTIQIQTNGRMFAYREFCEKTIKAGANQFSPALHGHIAELHDYLTAAKGSFEQTTRGIRNLKKLGQQVVANTVVTKSNYRHLPEIAKLLNNLGVDQYQFAFVHPTGSAFSNFESIVPRMTLIEPYIKKGLDIGIENKKTVMTEAIPYCFMRGYEKYIAEKIIPDTKIFDYQKIIEDFTEKRRTEGKTKGPNCQNCFYNEICEGPWREYPEKLGWNEFIPVKKEADLGDFTSKAIDRSFNFLIKESGLSKQRLEINNIKDILFSDFNESWLSKNQKFDFSLSSRKSGLRFSYNNFGEKEIFENKLVDIFSLFKKAYSVKQLEKLLLFMGSEGNKHQTTIGVEWLGRDELPRIKIYFEELFHVYTDKIIFEKLKEICRLLGIDFNKLGVGKKEKIGAISVDFVPFSKVNVKVYFLHRKIGKKELKRKAKSLGLDQGSASWEQFFKCLNREKQGFFYMTKRFASDSSLLSLKIYKIYEVSQINDRFKKSWQEIKSFLKAREETVLLKRVLAFETICKNNKLNLYPVIIAVDNTFERDNVDLYFSFKGCREKENK